MTSLAGTSRTRRKIASTKSVVAPVSRKKVVVAPSSGISSSSSPITVSATQSKANNINNINKRRLPTPPSSDSEDDELFKKAGSGSDDDESDGGEQRKSSQLTVKERKRIAMKRLKRARKEKEERHIYTSPVYKSVLKTSSSNKGKGKATSSSNTTANKNRYSTSDTEVDELDSQQSRNDALAPMPWESDHEDETTMVNSEPVYEAGHTAVAVLSKKPLRKYDDDDDLPPPLPPPEKTWNRKKRPESRRDLFQATQQPSLPARLRSLSPPPQLIPNRADSDELPDLPFTSSSNTNKKLAAIAVTSSGRAINIIKAITPEDSDGVSRSPARAVSPNIDDEDDNLPPPLRSSASAHIAKASSTPVPKTEAEEEGPIYARKDEEEIDELATAPAAAHTIHPYWETAGEDTSFQFEDDVDSDMAGLQPFFTPPPAAVAEPEPEPELPVLVKEQESEDEDEKEEQPPVAGPSKQHYEHDEGFPDYDMLAEEAAAEMADIQGEEPVGYCGEEEEVDELLPTQRAEASTIKTPTRATPIVKLSSSAKVAKQLTQKVNSGAKHQSGSRSGLRSSQRQKASPLVDRKGKRRAIEQDEEEDVYQEEEDELDNSQAEVASAEHEPEMETAGQAKMTNDSQDEYDIGDDEDLYSLLHTQPQARPPLQDAAVPAVRQQEEGTSDNAVAGPSRSTSRGRSAEDITDTSAGSGVSSDALRPGRGTSSDASRPAVNDKRSSSEPTTSSDDETQMCPFCANIYPVCALPAHVTACEDMQIAAAADTPPRPTAPPMRGIFQPSIKPVVQAKNPTSRLAPSPPLQRDTRSTFMQTTSTQTSSSTDQLENLLFPDQPVAKARQTYPAAARNDKEKGRAVDVQPPIEEQNEESDYMTSPDVPIRSIRTTLASQNQSARKRALVEDIIDLDDDDNDIIPISNARSDKQPPAKRGRSLRAPEPSHAGTSSAKHGPEINESPPTDSIYISKLPPAIRKGYYRLAGLDAKGIIPHIAIGDIVQKASKAPPARKPWFKRSRVVNRYRNKKK